MPVKAMAIGMLPIGDTRRVAMINSLCQRAYIGIGRHNDAAGNCLWAYTTEQQRKRYFALPPSQR